MLRSFDDLVDRAKLVFWKQPIHVDKVCDESGPMNPYLAAWTIVEAMSKREILHAVSDAVERDKPLPSRAGKFDQSSWTNLLTDALIVCMETELNQDRKIQAETQKRMSQ